MLCPNCGTENPEQAKFCFECASPLAAPAATARTERKVVSVLFCDLVGFTSRSESADPEDVLATVRPYHSLLRAQIEGFGGTVEKFIGDAVMAVFGAPVAHEDDAERAVRAGLKILESLQDLNEERGLDLSVRIGINTGEAVVSLGARPEQGEGIVTGDVVNTAARIQSGAPVGGIAVGEITYQATKDIFDYETLESIAAKGKSEPVPAWRAIAARARFGTDITRTHATPLVGRDVERALLQNLLERAIRDRSCQLVTIAGEPGVGKSRMVAELASHIDTERPELITWRQGRCLPYGDGITFWALGEIVKAHAGILESDSVDDVGEKLDRTLRATSLEAGEHEWLRARLAPLVGAESSGTAEQEESFTAWRRFLEAIAGSDPAIYVFEDLHWADASMLAFIEHLADWSEGVPMLLVGTARPELSETHPNWGAGLRNATTMNLAPLSEEETARLIGELLGQAALPAEVQAPILERAGGNPLYAEEFIRMLKDRGLLVQRGRTWELVSGAEIPFPEGVQGLIAARLDSLSPERKALLQDAAVIGKVFWSGALSAMGGTDERSIREALHELSRKELVRSSRQSSMEGESEYGFWHMLVRDVVYGQIPRASRAGKHVAAAEWIEAQAGERAEDLADVLAYHYAEALELVLTSGEPTGELTDRAVRFLVLAAERAASLDPARAAERYERALHVAPDGSAARPEILFGLGEVLRVESDPRSVELLREAVAAFEDARLPARAAEARLGLAESLHVFAPSPVEDSLMDEAIAILESLPPGRELVRAYSDRALNAYLSDEDEETIEWAGMALALASELGLPVDVRALRCRGGSRWFTGDRDGIEDLRRSVTLARERGLIRDAAMGHNELSNVLVVSEGPAGALREVEAGIELANRSGQPIVAMQLEASTKIELLYELGRWDEVLAIALPMTDPERSDVDSQSRAFTQSYVGHVMTWRNELDGATNAMDGLEEHLAALRELQHGIHGIDALAHLAVASGDLDRARRLLVDLGSTPNVKDTWNYATFLPELVRLALGAVDTAFAESLATGVPNAEIELARISLRMATAELAEARGELESAADLYASAEEGWRTFSVPERAQALLGRGRCLLKLGGPEADAVLKETREVFASLRANRFIPEVDALLERSLRLTS